jgi:hypothetical protein
MERWPLVVPQRLSGRNAELLAHTLVEIVDGRDLVILAKGSLEASNMPEAAFRVDHGDKEVHRPPAYLGTHAPRHPSIQ